MRRGSQRAAWTAFVESGGNAPRTNKYNVAPKEERGKYASKHEAAVAADLWALANAGNIKNLREQVDVVLVEGNGKMRPIIWRADFVYNDLDGFTHYCDAKGFRTPVYRLKKRLFTLLKGLVIDEL